MYVPHTSWVSFLPTANYAGETRKCTTKMTKWFSVFRERCLEKILRIPYNEFMISLMKKCYKRSGSKHLPTTVNERRTQFCWPHHTLGWRSESENCTMVGTSWKKEEMRPTWKNQASNTQGKSQNHQLVLGWLSPLENTCVPMWSA